MSPTVNTISVPTGENPIYMISQGRKHSDSSTASYGSTATDSSGGGSGGGGGERGTLAPLRSTAGYAADYVGVSAPSKSRAKSGGAREWFGAGREGDEEEEVEVLGAARLVHLPDVHPRGRQRGAGGGTEWDEEDRDLRMAPAHVQERPAFPASASVSIPTSTTALEYLLHQHTSGTRSPRTDTKNSVLNLRTPSFPSTQTTSAESTSSSTPKINSVSSGSTSGFLSRYQSGVSVGKPENAINENIAAMMTRTGADQTPSSGSDRQLLDGGDVPRKSPRARRRGDHDSKSVSQQFFHVEPCLYTHRMFLRAAKIFHVLKSEDTDTVETQASRRRRKEPEVKQKIPEMDFRNAQEQIKTFELTFATLKYQELFRDILDRTGFFHEFSNLRSDYSLVCIILFDLQSRKFQRRTPLPEEMEVPDTYADASDTPDGPDGPEMVIPPARATHLDDVCQEIENALLSRKTRLQSSFAKERIKRNAPSIEHLLPEQVRHKDETKSTNPVFCWVNQMKTSIESMIESFVAEGFSELEDGLDISEQTDKVFRRDPHCSDLLLFPPHLSMYFKDSYWVMSGLLVQQDKSSCLAPQTVQLLLGIDQDVIHVNVGTGMTTAHIASLLKHRSPNSHIWAFEPEEAERTKKAAKNLEFLGAKNAKIIQDHFLNVDPEDVRYRNVRIIMITANCTKSAITSPVQFIVSEGEDMQILGELSQADSNIARIRELTHGHESLLRHALKFPRVQAVVYTTRSRYKAENEQVVNQVLEAVNAQQNGKRVPFRVSPPVLPFSGDEIDTVTGVVDGKFARFQPSDRSNGCFVAIISREPEDPKEAARSAIARARSKGVLEKGDSQNQQTPEGDENSAGKSRSKSRRSNGSEGKSSPSGLKQKLSNHKSPAAVGARLYQAGLINRMEQAKLRAHKPEHVKVIKHPAPFSEPPQAAMP